MTISALLNKVLGMLNFCDKGWCESKGRYLPVCVGLRYTEVIREPSCFRVTVTSKKERVPFTSFSRVNFIEACIELSFLFFVNFLAFPITFLAFSFAVFCEFSRISNYV